MKTIWKFPFKITDHLEIQMPEDSLFLSVAEQNGQACIWCEVQPDKPTRLVRFELRGTGHPFDGSEGYFLGSFQILSESLVFHLFLTAEDS